MPDNAEWIAVIQILQNDELKEIDYVKINVPVEMSGQIFLRLCNIQKILAVLFIWLYVVSHFLLIDIWPTKAAQQKCAKAMSQSF